MKKPSAECITKTANQAGADVIVFEEFDAPRRQSWTYGYCHGCTEISSHYTLLRQATAWAQTHARNCNFG